MEVLCGITDNQLRNKIFSSQCLMIAVFVFKVLTKSSTTGEKCLTNDLRVGKGAYHHLDLMMWH